MARESRYVARGRTVYRRTVRRQKYTTGTLDLVTLATELGAVVR